MTLDHWWHQPGNRRIAISFGMDLGNWFFGIAFWWGSIRIST